MNVPVILFSFSSLIISCHPLLYIASNQRYQANQSNSLYIESDFLSIFSTNRYSIFSSLILYLMMIFSGNVLLGIPLLVISWTCFIRDRFRCISRGLGAPGYFCFLSVSTIFFANTNIFINSFHQSIWPLNLLSEYIFAALILEFGFIFLSAGLFKVTDLRNNNPMSFAIGLLNPMWSKLASKVSLIYKLKSFVNWLGPLLQIAAGILIISLSSNLQILGFILVALMFLSITPITKLSWLCPSIASLAFLNISLLPILSESNSWVVLSALVVRSLILCDLFLEYFTINSVGLKPAKYITTIYRKILGVIIWKVFTFDIVKYAAFTNNSLRASNARNDISKSAILVASGNTNVYDSITLVSLLSSKDYLNGYHYNSRLKVYLDSNSSECIYSLIIKKDAMLLEQKQLVNPFLCGETSITLLDTEPFLKPEADEIRNLFNNYSKKSYH